MARIRNIKPEFYSDTKLADITILCRYFYIGLFCQLDRQGVAVDDPKFLKREIFPYDDSVSVAEVNLFIDQLVESGRLIRFTYNDREYLYCPTFTAHQRFHKEEKTRYSIPADILSSLSPKGATVPAPPQDGAKSPDSGYTDSGKTEITESQGVVFDFELTWEEYPRKVGKTEARDRFDKLIHSQKDFEGLRRAIENYKRELRRNQTEEKYVLHLASFLGTVKKPKWRDWVEVEVSQLRPKLQPKSLEDIA